MKKKLLMAAVLSAALSPFAGAADFTFTGLGSVPDGGYTTTVDGITVTVTAPGESLGYLNLDGIGVKSNCCDLQSLQNNETLLVSFSEEVTIGQLGMRQWENGNLLDRADFASSGGSFEMKNNGSPSGLEDFWTLSSFGVGALTSFTITGTYFATVTNLSSLVDVQATSEVPLPAAAWLFGSGLIGLGGLARRKRG